MSCQYRKKNFDKFRKKYHHKKFKTEPDQGHPRPPPEMKSGAPLQNFFQKTDGFKMSQFAVMSITSATAIFETNFILFCSIFTSLCHVESMVIIKRVAQML